MKATIRILDNGDFKILSKHLTHTAAVRVMHARHDANPDRTYGVVTTDYPVGHICTSEERDTMCEVAPTTNSAAWMH